MQLISAFTKRKLCSFYKIEGIQAKSVPDVLPQPPTCPGLFGLIKHHVVYSLIYGRVKCCLNQKSCLNRKTTIGILIFAVKRSETYQKKLRPSSQNK